MNDPDIATWGEDGDRLDRDAEIESEPDHYRTVWFGVAGNQPEFVSKPACGCGNVYASENALTNHLKRELNP